MKPLDLIAKQIPAYAQKFGRIPTHVFLTREAWADLTTDLLYYGWGLDPQVLSETFWVMGLRCVITYGSGFHIFVGHCEAPEKM